MQAPSDHFAAQLAAGQDIHAVGELLRQQLFVLTDLLGAAGNKTAAYGATLTDAKGQLQAGSDPSATRAILERLINATRVMEAQNQALEGQLAASNTEIDRLRQRVENVQREAMTDPLTQISNRKSFDVALAAALADAKAKGEPLSLVMADVDRFKLFNDTHGHQTGDQVLKLVARCITDSVKGRDTAARFGGEEFAIILPNTAVENARIVAEQVRRTVESKRIIKRSTSESLGTITLSLGCAQWHPGEDGTDLIERADECLYAGKAAGRNRVVAETDPEYVARAQAAGQEPRVVNG